MAKKTNQNKKMNNTSIGKSNQPKNDKIEVK